MPRVSRGAIYRQTGSRNWFLKFYLDRQLKRETTSTSNRDEALTCLRRRLEDARQGRYMEIGSRISWAEMRVLLLENYRFKGNRTDPVPRLARLTEFFGSSLGEQITTDRVQAYSKKRLDLDGAAPATLRRELAILKRMLRLASDHLPRVPRIDLPRV